VSEDSLGVTTCPHGSLDADGCSACAIQRLGAAIDSLWSWMPVYQVREIEHDEPELAELCERIHHDLWHATTHEQRMTT
jgi:hypothetical protein